MDSRTPTTPAATASALEVKLDSLIEALHAHTVAVYHWADACNALLNAMLQSAEEEDAYITDLKGNRIPIHPTSHADSPAES
jgi:exonuclease V gamma subunit